MYLCKLDRQFTNQFWGAIVLDLWHHVFTEGHNQAIHGRELKEEPEVGMCQLHVIIMDMFYLSIPYLEFETKIVS